MPQNECCTARFAEDEWLTSTVHRQHYDAKTRAFERTLADWLMPSDELEVCVIEAEQPLEKRFREQAVRWNRETAHLSSPLQRMMHPSYQAILGMAAEHKRDVIRLLLMDLQQNQSDWLLTLSYLTQENPTDPKDAGKTDRLIRSWVKWGEGQGLL